jgi:threonyl-tRNA synthetase
LWETSGHLGFYGENMYAPIKIDEADVLPETDELSVSREHLRQPLCGSYRELPMRPSRMGHGVPV